MVIPLAYAVAAIFNKAAINSGVTPIVTVVGIMAVMTLSHLHVLKRSLPEIRQTLRDKRLRRLILAASVFGVGSVGFASLALSDAYTSYVLGIRRLDVLITVVIGWKFMGDGNFARRFTGAAVMTFGVLLVSLS